MSIEISPSYPVERLLAVSLPYSLSDSWTDSIQRLSDQEIYVIPIEPADLSSSTCPYVLFLVRAHQHTPRADLLQLLTPVQDEEIIVLHEIHRETSLLVFSLIDGMRCNACVKKIETVLQESQNPRNFTMDKIKVYLEAKLSVTEVRRAVSADDVSQTIKREIQALGFSATIAGSFERRPWKSADRFYIRGQALLPEDPDSQKLRLEEITALPGMILVTS